MVRKEDGKERRWLEGKMTSKLRMDKVFSLIYDNNFGLSEDESIDEDDDAICSYFGKSRIDGKAVLSMG